MLRTMMKSKLHGVTVVRANLELIPGERGSGMVGINGAAAHLVKPGDKVIICSYAQMTDDQARELDPRVCFVDAQNCLR